MKFIYIIRFIALTFTLPLVKARPRSSRQAGSSLTACQSRERLIDNEGTIASPNFPGPYPANSSCTWIITPPQNTNVSLTFTSFNIQSNSKQCDGSKCHCDFIQVKELDPPRNSAGFSAKYCDGNRPPNKIPYLMSRVRIRFVSDSTGEGTGFELNYKTLGAKAIAAAITTERPTKPGSSSNLNVSEFSIPLSTFTSKAQVNSTAGALLHVTPETRITPEFNGARTPLPRTFPVTSAGGQSVWTTTAHVVIAVEQKEVEEKVPDIIVLGPSVPVVMIFVLVVAAIAWWNYKFNSEELNRYESYAKNSAAKKRQKRTMHNISKGNLYNEMTKTWRGQSFNTTTGGSSPMVGRYRKISFAGRLLEGVRTPRPSRPSSTAEETMHLTKPSTGTGPGPFLSPGAATTGGGSKPSSRPASLLLRDALRDAFGGTEEGESHTQGSGSSSKRASKRVSFIDEETGQPLVKHESTPPEQIEENRDEPVEDDDIKEEPDAPEKPPRKLLIPAILVRQPSEDIDFSEESPSRSSREEYDPQREEDAIFVEESPDLEEEIPDQDADDEEEDGDDGGSPWNDLGANYPDSSLEDIPDRSLIFPDLEDFLLNLDKDSDLDEPPYSCAIHIRDILRKSYGDEGPSSLGSETVLNVPEEFLGMMRNSSLSRDGATKIKETDLVDDVD